MSDRKTMIPELLPDPKANTAASKTSPRERVVKQMREMLKAGLLTTGSAVASSCGAFGVVDPMPPPAQCHNISPNDTFEGIAQASTDTNQITVQIEDLDGNPDFRNAGIFDVEGGSAFEAIGTGRSTIMVVLLPEAGAKEMTFLVALNCAPDGSGAFTDVTRALRVTVFLDDATDGGMPLDGGTQDGGGADTQRPLRVEVESIRTVR